MNCWELKLVWGQTITLRSFGERSQFLAKTKEFGNKGVCASAIMPMRTSMRDVKDAHRNTPIKVASYCD